MPVAAHANPLLSGYGGPGQGNQAILGANIPLVEGLVNLAQLPPRCQFFAPFYHFAGIDSAPARAFALVEA